MEEISEAGVIHSQSRTISEIMERLKVCAEQRDAALDKLETLQKEHNALASSYAALRERDALRQQVENMQKGLLEENEVLTHETAEAQGQTRKLKVLNDALVTSLRHVTAALNALLEEVPEVKP
jgi:seryl-tRNA synthetase